jgi:hypothetical protein
MNHDAPTGDVPDDHMLHDAAQRLGERAAARLDVERVAQAVVARLREQPESTRTWRVRAVWLRVAAVAVLVVGGVLLVRPGTVRHTSDLAIIDGLSDLSPDQLEGLLQTWEQGNESGVLSVTTQEAGLEQLDASQLRELLRSLEG